MRRSLGFSALAVLSLLLAFGLAVVMQWLAPSLRIFDEVFSVDVVAGRTMRTDRFLGIRSRGKVEETGTSRLYRDLMGTPPPPEWRLDYRSAGGCYMHGTHRGATQMVEWLAQVLQSGAFTEEAAREALLAFLRLLRRSSSLDAGDYEERLELLVHNWEESGKVRQIGVPDLPTVQVLVLRSHD